MKVFIGRTSSSVAFLQGRRLSSHYFAGLNLLCDFSFGCTPKDRLTHSGFAWKGSHVEWFAVSRRKVRLVVIFLRHFVHIMGNLVRHKEECHKCQGWRRSWTSVRVRGWYKQVAQSSGDCVRYPNDTGRRGTSLSGITLLLPLWVWSLQWGYYCRGEVRNCQRRPMARHVQTPMATLSPSNQEFALRCNSTAPIVLMLPHSTVTEPSTAWMQI